MGPVAIDDEPTQELPVIAGEDPGHGGEITAEIPVVGAVHDEDGAGAAEGPARPAPEPDEVGDARAAPDPAPVRTIVIGDKDGISGSVAPVRSRPPVPSAVPNKRVGGLVFGGADGTGRADGTGLGKVVALGGALVIGDAVDDAEAPVPGAPPRTVVIGNPDESAPDGIDPRIKARRHNVLRAAGLRRLRWVLVVVAVVGLLLGTNLMLRSPLFDVRAVAVTGTSYIDQADLDAIRDPLVGQPLVSVNLDSVRRAVEANQWVRAVDVSRDWPHTIHIDILERRPVAYYPGDDGLIHLVDIDGRVLETLEGIPVGFVEVNGAGNTAGPGEDAPEALLPAIRVANDLPDSLRADVKAVRLVQEGVTLDLTAGGTILLGDTTDLREKLVSALAVRGQCPPGSYKVLDVRVPSRPAVSPKSGCGGSLNGTRP